jgi:hypothetical protein
MLSPSKEIRNCIFETYSIVRIRHDNDRIVLASAQWLVVLRQWLSIVLTRIQGSQADGAVEVPDWLLVVTGCVCLGSLEQPTISSISAISKLLSTRKSSFHSS